MNSADKKVCKFCLKTVKDDFNMIGETIKQMFDVLLLKPICNIGKDKVICNGCTTKLQNAVDFKSNYLVKSEDIKTVLKEEIELNNIYDKQKLCQFCKKLIENGAYLDRENDMVILDMIQKYIPELRSNVSEELITCQNCFDSLHNFLSFMIHFLNVEDKIECTMDGTLCEVTLKYEVNHRNVQNKDIFVMENCLMEINNPEFNIKNEEIEIKSEENFEESFQDGTSNVILENEFKTNKYELDMDKHIQTHENTSEIMYMYEKLQEKRDANINMFTQRDPLAVNIFKCEICSYQTNRKGNLKLHIMTHQIPANFNMYKCERCSYATDKKHSLQHHMITHKSPSEIKMYKCTKCSFKSKHQSSCERHIIRNHQNPSELITYKCESCPFQSKYESSLIRHLLTHQNLSEIKIYRCESCPYNTPQKDRLRRHILTHQKASEITMYKCDRCSYETKRNDKLKQHMLTHQDFSEVKTYKCEKCSYKTIRKDNIKQHMVTHQRYSGNKIYKCEMCPYMTKYKGCLDKHKLTHQTHIQG